MKSSPGRSPAASNRKGVVERAAGLNVVGGGSYVMRACSAPEHSSRTLTKTRALPVHSTTLLMHIVVQFLMNLVQVPKRESQDLFK